MEDIISTTSTMNICQRLKQSCVGIVFGVILFLGAFPLLFWNEQRAIERYNALEEGESQTITVDSNSLDPSNNGKLVHFTADVYNGGSNLTDSTFGIGCMDLDCLGLQRHTEMYQWNERTETDTETKAGGTQTTVTNYYYDQTWSGSLINSGSFYDQSSQYKNPSSIRFPSQDFIADPMMAGAYQLPSEIVDYMLNDQDPIDVSVNQISDATSTATATATLQEEAKAIYSTPGDGYYLGTGTEQSPQIGDEKLWFSETPQSEITVVGVQTDKTIAAFVSESGKGGNVLLYRTGNLTSTEMFEIAAEQNRILTIVLRVVGFAVMALGQIMIWSPFKVMADVIPIVGGVIGCGINFVSITIAAVLSAITIAIAWLIVHPTIGLIVLGSSLAVIGLCAFGVKMLLNRNGNGNGNGDDHNDNGEAVAVPARDDDKFMEYEYDPEEGKDGGDFANALDK